MIKWISVLEELPPKEKMGSSAFVLVKVKKDHVAIASYHHQEETWLFEGCGECNGLMYSRYDSYELRNGVSITHWAPIFEPRNQ